jgi:hypothetical protein
MDKGPNAMTEETALIGADMEPTQSTGNKR